ncbi:heavy-metal-associated domain-containing protein [Halosimplex halobium]|uniref:heavy-metal-associated domain-containing protein n=1 Tax=Halosimplex halobium TaxID=3396618 RepID=UPI003F57DA04
MAEHTIPVDGMTCANCERTVASAVSCVAGVESVEADADAGRVTVDCHEDCCPTVRDCIAGLGFDVPDEE